MNEHVNLTAYDSYEKFKDYNFENSYRISKLESCQKHIDLIRQETGNKLINILELGSGNSKLLVNLHQNQLLNFGWGVEISKSRFDFANKWINDLGINTIRNVNDDIINFDYDLVSDLDVCICVDLCFQFLEPIKKSSDEFILKKVFSKLKSSGKIILELDYCGYIINNFPYTKRVWEEFPETDPWKYSLWNCEFDEQTKILNWNKTFISRENDYESTSIQLRIYDKYEIECLLNKIGFKNIRIYRDWNYSPFHAQLGEFIIIAEK